MDFRFAAYDPATGEFLRMLPRPATVQIGDTFGTRGTLELSFAGGLALETFLEVRAQVSFGGEWTPVGPALLRLGGSHEDTDQAGMRTVTFVSREWVLGKARVGEGDLELIDGKRPFYQASPGEIMRTLLLEAQDRGAAAGIELGGFTAARDSAGNAWPKVATIYYGPGLPIASVLENLVEQGMCDYRMNGRVLELYAPETELGRDLTTGDPVRVHGSVTEAPVTYTLEDLTTSALLIGEEGFELEVANPSAPRDYGELEVTIEQGGVNSEGTARTLIDAELQRGSREIREITRTQAAATAAHLPFRDYRVGDYVQAYDAGRWERYRVREIQLVMGDEGWTIHTVLNDRLQELLLKLAKRTNGIVNGTKGTGGDGTTPAPAPKPGIEPAAPRGLIVDQQVYLDAVGNARGLVTAGWGAVTEDVRGRGIDVGGYELWRRDNETYAPWRMVSSTDGDTETTDSPVWLTRGDGTAAEYQWRARAVAEASGRAGEWSSVVTMTMTQDTTPPPPPSAPVVTTGFRIVTVEWDGLTEDGTDMPADFSRVRVYLAGTEDMADASLAGSLSYPGTWNSETMPADVPVWVTMTAVDRVGNESDPTDPVSITPRALVSDEDIRDALDRVEGDIDAVKGSRTYQAYPPNRDGANVDDVWYQIVDGSTVGWWRWDGDSWVEQGLDTTIIPKIDIGTGTFGELDGVRLKAGSVVADTVIVPGSVGGTLIEDGAVKTFHLAANAVEADTIAAGAIDGKIITGATVRTAATGARVVLNQEGLYAYNTSGGQTLAVNARTGVVDLTGNMRQTNSWGYATFGPSIYDNEQVSPALRFGRNDGYGETYPPGIYLRKSSDGPGSEARFQGAHDNTYRGSDLQLASGVGGSNSGITFLRRSFEQNAKHSGLYLYGDRDAYLTTVDGTVMLRSRNAADTQSSSWLSLPNGTTAYLYNRNRDVRIASRTAGNDGDKAALSLQSGGDARLGGRGSAVIYSGTGSGRVYLYRRGSDGANYERLYLESGGALGLVNTSGVGFTRSSSGFTQMRGGAGGEACRVAISDTNNVWVDANGGEIHLRERNNAGTSSGAELRVRNGNSIEILANNLDIYRLSSGSGVNIVQSGSRIYRASSSRRNKLLVEDATYDTPDLEDRLLNVQPRSWYEVGNSEAYAEYLDALDAWEPLAEGESCEACEAEDAAEPCPTHREPTPAAVPRRNLGAVAEEVEELGLEHLVVYDPDGKPDGLMYDRFGVLLIPTVKRLRDRVDELERLIKENTP